MTETKTKPTSVSVDRFLKDVPDEQRRADAQVVLAMLREVTGEKPTMWGPTMVGFGQCHYVYNSGHEGDCFLTGFSPRSSALVLYFHTGFEKRLAAPLAKLGKCKVSKSCLYLNKLADVDLKVLRQMMEANFADTKEWVRQQAAKATRPAAKKKPAATKKKSAAKKKKPAQK